MNTVQTQPPHDAPAPGQRDEPGGIASSRASWAGMLGAAAALSLAELVAGFTASVPPLTTSVGQLFIPFTPEWLKRIAIALFGTADKPVFVAGVVIVSLALGAWAGRRARTSQLPAVVLYVGLALFGVFASLDQPGASAGAVVVSTLLAAGVGLAVMTWLLGLARENSPSEHDRAGSAPDAERPADGETSPEPQADGEAAGAVERPVGRRPFLVGGVAVAAGAAGSTLLGNALRRARIEDVISSTDITLPDVGAAGGPAADLAAPVRPANMLDVPGITPIVVPGEDFYRIDTAIGTPLVDAATWEMKVTGMVERELTLTYEDLLARDVVERYVTLSCVSNEVGGGLVGNALWRGVLLGPLLEEAGIEPGAGQVVGRSVDGWAAGFPTEAAFDRDSMIAFAMNGEPLPAAHGFPARLVVPGLYGYVSATKWLAEIELTTWEGFDGYWIPRGWSKEGPVKTQSRIDVPRDGTRLETPGETVIAGVAWAPGRGIAKVEVRRDEEDWVEAVLSEPLAAEAWVQWRATLELPDGVSEVQVRATDGEGETQPAERTRVAPDGATGHHTIRVFT